MTGHDLGNTKQDQVSIILILLLVYVGLVLTLELFRILIPCTACFQNAL